MIINIDINKLVVSSKLSFCKQDFRYFIGYIEDKKNRPLCIFLSKTSEYIKDFGKNKCTSCLIKGEEFSKSIMKLWKKSATASKKNLIVNHYLIKNT